MLLTRYSNHFEGRRRPGEDHSRQQRHQQVSDSEDVPVRCAGEEGVSGGQECAGVRGVLAGPAGEQAEDRGDEARVFVDRHLEAHCDRDVSEPRRARIQGF